MFSNQLKPIYFAIILGLATVFSACNHHDHDNDDPVPHQPNMATITITSPAEGSEVTGGQTITITGTIVADQSLHGYSVIVRRKADLVEIFRADPHDHSANITINQPWQVGPITELTDLELEVVTALDHDGNLASKKVNFKARP